jgi:hypothetical protein
MSFDSFLRKRHQKYYSDMPYEYYLRSLEGPARPGFDPVKVEGTGGEPMEPTEAMMGVTPMKGIEKFYPEIGGTVGGMVAGVTVGGMVAGVPGAAVGGAIGEAGREFAEGEDLSGEKILVEGGIQGLWEKGGRLAEKGITKLLSPSAGKILPETKEAVEHFGKYGGYISPAQQAEGKLIDLAEGVSEASITGGPRFFKFRENQAKAFEATADDLIERMGSSMDEFDVGVLFVEEIGKSDLAFRTQASAFYKNVDRLTAGAGVDLRPLKEFAEEQMEKALAREGIGGSAAGDMLTKKVVKLDDFISFEEADKLRSGFGAEISSFEGKKDAAAGVAKKYFGLTSESMENSAKALGDEAHAAWEKARTFYKEGKATFQSKYMRGLVGLMEDSRTRRGAEAIVGQIFKPGRESAIREVKRALKDKPQVWNNLNTFRNLYQARIKGNTECCRYWAKVAVTPKRGRSNANSVDTSIRSCWACSNGF